MYDMFSQPSEHIQSWRKMKKRVSYAEEDHWETRRERGVIGLDDRHDADDGRVWRYIYICTVDSRH